MTTDFLLFMKWNKPQTIFLLSALLIVSLGILIYSNSLNNAFHFDDMFFIVDKPEIRELGNLPAIWHAHSHPARFIAFYSFALNYHFHQYQVFGYHLFNLAVHLLNAILVWWLVRLLFMTVRLRNDPLNQFKEWIALFAALIFVSHPLQTQAVTYISQRFASLAALFYLFSVCMYLKGRLGQSRQTVPFFCAAALSALLGMFTKQIVFTLPLALIMIELMMVRKGRIQWPVLLCVGVFLLVVPGIFAFDPSILNIQHLSESHDGDRLNPLNYFLTQMPVLITYLRLLVLPFGQNLDYDFPAYNSFFHPNVFVSFLILAGLLIWSFKLLRSNRLLAFGLLWFFVTISVESTFITIKNVIFEHRMYLPMAGLAVFISVAVFTLMQKKRTAVVFLSVIVAAFGLLTYQRNFIWRDGVTLWTDVVKKSPQKARPHISLAIAYIQDERYDEALAQLNTALALDPNAYKAYNNRGLVFSKKGLYREAINEYDRAIQLKPDNPVTYNNRGDAYRELGQDQAAYDDYAEAIRINPYYAQAYINRGVFYGKNNDLELALADFTVAIRINPTLPESYNNRGIVYQQKKMYDLAESDFNKAIRMKPGYADAYYNRGNVYKDLGQFVEALNDYNIALKIRNNYPQVYNNRGIIYGNNGKNNQALEDFNTAISYDPGYSAAYFNRSIVHLKQGAYQDALADTLKARELGKSVDELYIERIKSLIKPQTE